MMMTRMMVIRMMVTMWVVTKMILQGLEDIIRDTGPVDSNLTSANASKYNSEVGHK